MDRSRLEHTNSLAINAPPLLPGWTFYDRTRTQTDEMGFISGYGAVEDSSNSPEMDRALRCCNEADGVREHDQGLPNINQRRLRRPVNGTFDGEEKTEVWCVRARRMTVPSSGYERWRCWCSGSR